MSQWGKNALRVAVKYVTEGWGTDVGAMIPAILNDLVVTYQCVYPGKSSIDHSYNYSHWD